MSVLTDLQTWLETEERSTVGDAFGGPKQPGRSRSYSIPQTRNKVLAATPQRGASDLDDVLVQAKAILPSDLFETSVENLLRFSFVIELTNLTVGSTKMKTRWLTGKILMSQPGSFEPIQGEFRPGNDPRASPFSDCASIFVNCLNEVCRQYTADNNIAKRLKLLNAFNSVPYEFVFDYIDPALSPVHVPSNIKFAFNDDIKWLLLARPLVNSILDRSLLSKIQTKTYKTDRALTGKDKTNRAKRWEVLNDDFQHASLENCWSVERKLIEDLVFFDGFDTKIKEAFLSTTHNLLSPRHQPTICPVTLEPLSFPKLTGDITHGRSEYQVGHLHPLKRGGKHTGVNICWQSADGNRIQGDLTIEETIQLLDDIYQRKSK